MGVSFRLVSPLSQPRMPASRLMQLLSVIIQSTPLRRSTCSPRPVYPSQKDSLSFFRDLHGSTLQFAVSLVRESKESSKFVRKCATRCCQGGFLSRSSSVVHPI